MVLSGQVICQPGILAACSWPTPIPRNPCSALYLLLAVVAGPDQTASLQHEPLPVLSEQRSGTTPAAAGRGQAASSGCEAVQGRRGLLPPGELPPLTLVAAAPVCFRQQPRLLVCLLSHEHSPPHPLLQEIIVGGATFVAASAALVLSQKVRAEAV